jgi:hypothetical protein
MTLRHSLLLGKGQVGVAKTGWVWIHSPLPFISLFFDRAAEPKVRVSGPAVVDHLKDWIVSLTGKIEYRQPQSHLWRD